MLQSNFLAFTRPDNACEQQNSLTMSDIDGDLQFAPGIPFHALDFRSGKLADQFEARIEGFYIDPALSLAKNRFDFAAGLLAVCAADALGGIFTGASGTRSRMVGFFRTIPGLDRKNFAELFCDDFRNGLVHDARVKNGGKFSINYDDAAVPFGSSLEVNPYALALNVRKTLREQCAQARKNAAELKALAAVIKRRFEDDIKATARLRWKRI